MRARRASQGWPETRSEIAVNCRARFQGEPFRTLVLCAKSESRSLCAERPSSAWGGFAKFSFPPSQTP